MDTLLLEIGTEEIPAGYINPALKALAETLQKKLTAARIEHGSAEIFGSPRRLAVHHQEDRRRGQQHTASSRRRQSLDAGRRRVLEMIRRSRTQISGKMGRPVVRQLIGVDAHAQSMLARGAPSMYFKPGFVNSSIGSCTTPPRPASPNGMMTSPSTINCSPAPGVVTMRIARSVYFDSR